MRGKARARGPLARVVPRQGHEFAFTDEHGAVITRGGALVGRWRGAKQAGTVGHVVDDAPGHWGLAARGATVEAGAPMFEFPLHKRADLWADEAARLYAQAAAAQWDPATAIPWDVPFDIPDGVEDAVVQIMTYLIENETAALIIPAKFAAQVHPHFREVMQLLAIQAADEARHIEVFTRRALLRRSCPGLSTTGGQASLEPSSTNRISLLARSCRRLLGGSFLSLLWFM